MKRNVCLLLLLWTVFFPAVGKVPDNKDSLRAAAFHQLTQGNPAEAKKYGRRLLELGKKENDRDFCELYGHLILGVADIDDNKGSGTAIYAHLETARTIAERTRNHEALVSVFNGLGMYTLFADNDVYSALSYYFQALEEARTINDRRRYAIILANISGAYFMRNDTSGLKFAEEAIEIARQCDETLPLYYGTMNAAFYYLMTDSLDRAESSIREAEQIREKNGFTDESDHCLLRALLNEKCGNISEAYRYYALAMENFATASSSTITMVYLEYARLLRTDHHIASAVEVLEHGLDWVNSGEMPIHKAQLLRELSLSCREAGRYSKALDYALAYQENQDTLFDEMRERALQETRIKHDIFSREQQISRQQEVISRNHYRMTILGVILVLLMLALGMTYFFYKKKERLYRAIVLQNSEYMLRERMLVEQIEKARQPDQPSPSVVLPTDKQHDLMSRFTSLMIERKLFTDPSLTVAAVAEALGTNRTYLSRAVNESAGKTFTQVVNDYRIRQAISEIADLKANKPLKQISTEVGFNSLSTFYSTFQAFTGMTPALYRSKLREIG